MLERSERTVAVVNGLLVLVLPLAFLLAGSLLRLDSDTAVTVHAPGASRLLSAMSNLVPIAMVLLPFAALAAWRSQVYARRWRDRHDRGWPAVIEAGACGLVVTLVILAPGIVTRPREAPPYVLVYGGGALVMGILVGLFLRMTAILVLRHHEPGDA